MEKIVVKKDCRLCKFAQFDLDGMIFCMYRGGYVERDNAQNCDVFELIDSLSVEE